VLLVGSKFATVIGHPLVPQARVTLQVEEITLDQKVTILKFRRRKNSRRRKGFRRQLTILRVTNISPPASETSVLSTLSN
jgi:large subunit ribosomal protein L21